VPELLPLHKEEEDNLSGDDIDPILEELHIAMNKLSLIERNALSKSFDGKKLTVAERQAKSRAKKHLAEILKK